MRRFARFGAALLAVLLLASCGKPIDNNITQSSSASASAGETLAGGQSTEGADASGASSEASQTKAGGANSTGAGASGTQATGTLAATPSANNGAALLQALQATVTAKRFTLAGELAGGTMSITDEGASLQGIGIRGLVLVVDQEKLAMEQTVDWPTEDTKEAKAQAAEREKTLGKKMRSVMTADKLWTVFPEKKRYVDMTAAMAMMGESLADEMNSAVLLEEFFGDTAAIGKAKVSQETLDGKTYICGTTAAKEGVVHRFYFLNGALKRIQIEVEQSGAATTRESIDVESFTQEADASYFSIAGMKELSMLQLSSLMG
jgi:hypothetical protein